MDSDNDIEGVVLYSCCDAVIKCVANSLGLGLVMLCVQLVAASLYL
jgi:hypothetical protein